VRIAVRVLPTDGRQAVHQAEGEVVGQLEPQAPVELDLALRGWLELP
jgi:hypothetical protein